MYKPNYEQAEAMIACVGRVDVLLPLFRRNNVTETLRMYIMYVRIHSEGCADVNTRHSPLRHLDSMYVSGMRNAIVHIAPFADSRIGRANFVGWVVIATCHNGHAIIDK